MSKWHSLFFIESIFELQTGYINPIQNEVIYYVRCRCKINALNLTLNDAKTNILFQHIVMGL